MKKGMISVLSTLVGAGAGAAVTGKVMSDIIGGCQKLSDKHLALFLMMNQWVKIKQEGKNLADYFKKHNYKTIAVYGMSYAGETLLEELKSTDICVKYGIDKKADLIHSDVAIVDAEDGLVEVDAVVVTPITFFEEIEAQLNQKLDCPIISLEDILYEI